MGKKYIVKLDDNKLAYTAIIIDGVPYIKPLQLLPYTEPDLEQVRKEAYENGYENGFVAGHLKAEKSGQSFYEDGYQRGMADAWECARKIAYYSCEERIYLFKEAAFAGVLEHKSPDEAIEKIRAYEQEKEEQIHVGDEVNAPFGKAIVVNIDSVAEKIWLVYADGHGGFEYFKDAPTKTGRHFPEIAEVLQKMRENNDNK